MNKLKATLKLPWLLSSQFVLDPQRFLRSLRGLPVFLRDWAVFRKNHPGKMKLMPCLHDRYEEGGTTKSEYFWQDLACGACHSCRQAGQACGYRGQKIMLKVPKLRWPVSKLFGLPK